MDPIIGPFTIAPRRLWRSVELNDPVGSEGLRAKATLGLSIQSASPVLKNVLDTSAPKIFTGNREFDSTLVCACSATCALRSGTAASIGSSSVSTAPAAAVE